MHSLIGSAKRTLDTPILCIDLDVMEANLKTMADEIQRAGKQWRPHSKCHKTPEIARRQLEAGAIGVTCAKVSEAEVMAVGGVHDILIANMIVGDLKLNRVAALCREADPIVACDHYQQAEMLSAMCVNYQVKCRMIVEVDLGMNRVGVRPGRDVLQLAQAIDLLPGVELVGIMGYEGHLLMVADQDEKRTQIQEAMSVLNYCQQMLLEKGLNCEIISAGGTGSYQITSHCDGPTEIQAGGGIFADPMYRNQCHLTGHEYALSVLTTVVSRPTLERAVVDCGHKAINPAFEVPTVKHHPDAMFESFSAEHGMFTLGPNSRDLKIGDKIELIVGYADFTTPLHDSFYGFRQDRLEVVWPILGRGKLQ